MKEEEDDDSVGASHVKLIRLTADTQIFSLASRASDEAEAVVDGNGRSRHCRHKLCDNGTSR